MLSSWVCTKRPFGAPEFTYGRDFYKFLTKAGVDVAIDEGPSPKLALSEAGSRGNVQS